MEFQAGDSETYPMGKYFIDRARAVVPGATCSVEGRNISGKVLRDQTFDDANTYASQPLDDTLSAILAAAGLDPTEYLVQPGATFNVGMEFPRDMSFLEGVQTTLRTSLNWVIRERLDGKVVLGSTETYLELPQNSRYSFSREEDVFSRSIERDDTHSYSRVCVVADITDPATGDKVETAVYQDVVLADENWSIPTQKTLYVAAPDETPESSLTALAEDLALRVASAGTVETFIGPWRPHLLCGDEAEISSEATGSKLLGVITSITHRFGKSGYYTEFTVDSGGRIGQTMLSDYIQRIQDSRAPSRAKRL